MTWLRARFHKYNRNDGGRRKGGEKIIAEKKKEKVIPRYARNDNWDLM
jgi:hypothetical protein